MALLVIQQRRKHWSLSFQTVPINLTETESFVRQQVIRYMLFANLEMHGKQILEQDNKGCQKLTHALNLVTKKFLKVKIFFLWISMWLLTYFINMFDSFKERKQAYVKLHS